MVIVPLNEYFSEEVADFVQCIQGVSNISDSARGGGRVWEGWVSISVPVTPSQDTQDVTNFLASFKPILSLSVLIPSISLFSTFLFFPSPSFSLNSLLFYFWVSLCFFLLFYPLSLSLLFKISNFKIFPLLLLSHSAFLLFLIHILKTRFKCFHWMYVIEWIHAYKMHEKKASCYQTILQKYLNLIVIIVYWSRIHERTFSLRFLGIILRVLRLEVSVYNVYISNQFQTTFAQGGGGGI